MHECLCVGEKASWVFSDLSFCLVPVKCSNVRVVQHLYWHGTAESELELSCMNVCVWERRHHESQFLYLNPPYEREFESERQMKYLVHVQSVHFCAKYKSVMKKSTLWCLIETSIWLRLGLNCDIISLPISHTTVWLLGPSKGGKCVWGFGNWCLQTLNNNSAFSDS